MPPNSFSGASIGLKYLISVYPVGKQSRICVCDIEGAQSPRKSSQRGSSPSKDEAAGVAEFAEEGSFRSRWIRRTDLEDIAVQQGKSQEKASEPKCRHINRMQNLPAVLRGSTASSQYPQPTLAEYRIRSITVQLRRPSPCVGQ